MNKITYNLNKLLKPYDFPTDPKDNIKNIKITLVRLSPHNGSCDITINIPNNSERSIYEMAKRWINFEESEIIDIFNIKEIGLAISFYKYESPVLVKINANGSHNADNLRKEEHQLVEKYLQYWKLVK